ncbi:MAG: prepilin-type N-terminal cleavage/methylation domain-containing protein [Candidatus Aminicenantes bacterium]|nr:prepilin-type N-terminal cleavage/methylation domain-containing protein [Candidatus Aminicenantes bacterium]MDH5383481.1 prepilin-type N-terminal cleavage/methylation domain-containing protein [Candidatus Aminicenantes bacterium]MDH5744203.1 prepilin-type N-terminal cleavage/methylation domain-containing protein [Candidatus Aminicenantes bacterium]
MKSRVCARGFTLLELVIYISIFAVLVGIASSSFLNFSHKYRLQRAIWDIHSKMNYARFKAVFSGTKFRLSFNPDGYTLERYDQDLKTWNAEMGNILEGVHVQANNSPIFHPQGTVSNLASITVSNASGSYKITLAISGRIKVVKL